MISFMTMFFVLNEKRVQIVRFTRETSGDHGKLFDIDIYPDGTERYGVNCRTMENLPDLPSTKKLKEIVATNKATAVSLLAHEIDSPEYRAAWWAISDSLKKVA